MDHDGASLLGNHYSQTDHKTGQIDECEGACRRIGMTTGMGKTPSGYGHKTTNVEQKSPFKRAPGESPTREKEVNNRAGRHPAQQK